MQYQLADLFESIVDVVPDRDALVTYDDDGELLRRLTYRQLDERANQLAHHLRSAGIGKGDHVGMHLMNGTEYVEGMLACQKISAVPVNINYRYVEEELRYLYDDADLACLLFGAEFADRVASVAPSIDTLRHHIVVGEVDDDVTLPEGTVPYEQVTAEQPTDRVGGETRSPDDVWLLYTGGTTGMPKGTMWTHEDVFFAGMGGGSPVEEPVKRPEELAERIDPAGGQIVMFAAPPLMHGAAELGTYIGFWAANRVVLIRKYSGEGAVKVIAKEGVNTISLVGDAMARPLVQAMKETDQDISSLFVFSTAGAILSNTVREELLAVNPNMMIIDSFGSSESGYAGSAAEGSSPDSGLVFSMGDSFRVVSDDHRVIETPGEVGTVARFGHIPLGYYGDEDKTARTFPTIDGTRYVLLGDRAYIGEDGLIHVLGRGSVCINSGGEKIFPEEVEAAVKSHPDVVDAVVAGIPDETWGERVGVVIELAEGKPGLSQADLAEHLADRIARYKVPRSVAIVDRMVRSPAGKADYKWARVTLAQTADATA